MNKNTTWQACKTIPNHQLEGTERAGVEEICVHRVPGTKKRLSLVPCLRLASHARWFPFSPFWRPTTQVIIQNILITARILQAVMWWRHRNTYITIELTDNIGIRKLILQDVKVNHRTLAKSHHHRGTRGWGEGVVDPLLWVFTGHILKIVYVESCDALYKMRNHS